jgi:CDP-diacylglycerol pyrophosphatase
VNESLSEEDVIDVFYHSAFHESVPGILTSLGLLATFVAILLALAGVAYNPDDPAHAVSGIDQLINGLSGKFLSSIIALALSVIFTLLEKKVCDRQLLESYTLLVRRAANTFPLLTQTRILLDIQRAALRQLQPHSSADQG